MNIYQEELNNFLDIGEELELRGLTGGVGDSVEPDIPNVLSQGQKTQRLGGTPGNRFMMSWLILTEREMKNIRIVKFIFLLTMYGCVMYKRLPKLQVQTEI